MILISYVLYGYYKYEDFKIIKKNTKNIENYFFITFKTLHLILFFIIKSFQID